MILIPQRLLLTRFLPLVIFSGMVFQVFAKEPAANSGPVEISGIYPHLAMFNHEGECGVGAVVPWAERLWVITYGPHLPFGSSDKLYEITHDLRQIIRRESVGGTPACRMIHEETGQLLIGPYVINEEREVRVIPPRIMPGRLTAIARHLNDPANKAYYATMEDGLYEVNLRSLEVSCLLRDRNLLKKIPEGVTAYTNTPSSQLPGYHGKGLYMGQERLVFANNGERRKEAEIDPHIPSGALAEWGGSGDFSMIRRNQFTEVTGPGGIHGNPHPVTDPVWSIGWDTRSLILMVLEDNKWHPYRLPKASHTYDGAHGWHTEWPRIRDVGQKDLLMTMHGTFWKFPRMFSRHHSGGIRPRSTYLKIIGDFCRWGERLVFGCDDTAKSEFTNKQAATGSLASPGQSQSNLWFTKPSTPDHLGPLIGWCALWLDESVKAAEWSDPYLLAGYSKRCLFLSHGNETPVRFDLEIDRSGSGVWSKFQSVEVPPKGSIWKELPQELKGEWIRVRADRDCAKATATLEYAGADQRPTTNGAIFKGLARLDAPELMGGLLRTRGGDRGTLAVRLTEVLGTCSTMGKIYELNANLKLIPLSPKDEPEALQEIKGVSEMPRGILQTDEASLTFVDSMGKRWRLPKSEPLYAEMAKQGVVRIAREVCTERDLLNCEGTFYELPAGNAGGIAMVRPIATHHRWIQDFCSYRGLLVMSGIEKKQGDDNNPHIIRSEDGKAALWVGVADDLWKLGKPRGQGGPWKATPVLANVPSDPYLMRGFDHKSLTLINHGNVRTTFILEADCSGEGHWAAFRQFTLNAGQQLECRLPDWFQASWVRFIASTNTKASATLTYD